MANATCQCGQKAEWWMTGSGIYPHAVCDGCRERLMLVKAATAQALSTFEHLPVVVSTETFSVGEG